MAAVTHDTGLEFSESSKRFTHRIDNQIDRERAKILGDLAFASSLSGYALIERPDIPLKSLNAAGDAVTTDGRLAVLFFSGAR